METFQLIGYAGALALGWIMGATGSGGSALAVPMFNHVFLLDMHASTAHALFVVGISAAVGAWLNQGGQKIDWRLSLLFSLPMIITVYLVRRVLLPLVPKELFQVGGQGQVIDRDLAIMLLFGLLLTSSALITIRDRGPWANTREMPRKGPLPIVAMGMGIGVLTGITGMGGGFLIVPVLLILFKLPIKRAIATSLIVIALKSLAGFLGDLGQVDIHWPLLYRFTALSLAGMYLGVHCSRRLADKALKKGFGFMVLGISILVFYKALSPWV